MTLLELLLHIDSFAPLHLAADWDNSGLMIGSWGAEVSKVAVTLDAVSSAVIEAADKGCNVLVCHHPLIFRPIKRIDDETEQGRTILEAIRRNMNIIAVHTNWDVAGHGVNQTLAELLGLQDITVLDTKSGLGACGDLKKAMDVDKFMKHVKKAWGLSHLDVYGHTEKIKKVALCGGAGAEFWKLAWGEEEADIYLTADMKYHEISDAVNDELVIGLADHGEMERASLPSLAKEISRCGVETVILNAQALPAPARI